MVLLLNNFHYINTFFHATASVNVVYRSSKYDCIDYE